MKLVDAAKKNPNAILIHSGILFDVFNPICEDITINDVAHPLSHLCRYGGHTPEFYSVAQHSVLCSLQPGTPQEQMEFLMHDISEAFMVDLPSPIKRNMPIYVQTEENLLKALNSHFKLQYPLSDKVHKVDRLILEFEYEKFFDLKDNNFVFWTSIEAKVKFIARYYELKKQIEENV